MQIAEGSSEPKSFSNLAKRLDRFGASIFRFFEKEKHLLLVLWSITYFGATCYRASRKLFWFDEIFTVSLAGLPSLASLWHALIQGADFNPPLLYVATRISESMLGHGEIGVRMPEIVAFWIFCLCLYRFVSLRTTALAGFVSMSIPLVTIAYFYAYEARAHGLVLGFCGIALISWQAAAERTGGRAWLLLALGASLGCALLTHSYAFVLFLPLILGESVRFLRTRRPDLPMWLTLCVASCAIVVSLPLLGILRTVTGGAFFPARISSLAQTYRFLFAPAATVLGATLVLLSTAGVLVNHSARVSDWNSRVHEIAALVGLVLVPVLTFTAARVTQAPMIDRYSVSAIAGIACLAAIATAERPVVSALVLFTLLFQITIDLRKFAANTTMEEPSSGIQISTSLRDLNSQYAWLAQNSHRELPIVLLDNLEFLPILYYAPPGLLSRMISSRGDEIAGQDFARLRACCDIPGRIVSVNDMRATAPEFLAYGTPGFSELVDSFRKQGASVSLEGAQNGHFLFRVQYAPSKPGNAQSGASR